MKRNFFSNNIFRTFGLVLAFLLSIFSINAQTQSDEDEVQTRQIIPVFAKSRQKSSSAIKGKSYQAKKSLKARIRVAQRTNSGLNFTIAQKRKKPFVPNTQSNRLPQPQKTVNVKNVPVSLAKSQKMGLTLWKMEDGNKFNFSAKPSNSRDLVHPISGLVPTRVSTETPFRAGEKIRLSIESPSDGYLYVLNCEVYDDDSRGTLSLIFPTTRTRNGNNFVTAGSPIEFPAATDSPSYFEFRPMVKAKKAVAEALIFMVTKTPIENFTPQELPLIVDYEKFEKWEKKWSGKLQIWENESELGKPYTQAEFESASETRTRGIASDGRLLKPNEPEPQTLFTVETQSEDGLIVTLLLRYL